MEQILSQEFVPIPVAKEIVKKVKEQGTSNPIIERTLEYLSRFSKCDAKRALEAMRELTEKLDFSPITATILVNIVPKTIDEARVLLDFEKRLVETETLEQALDIIRRKCLEEST
ncbi:MAG: hypothetical protein ABWW69_04310 [Pyrodictiaceae archaeon]